MTEVMVKVVGRDQEREARLTELGVSEQATDAEIIAAVERRYEQELRGYVVTRHETNILVSPAPVFG